MCIPKNTLEASLKSLLCTFQKVIQKKNQEIEPFLELGSLGKKTQLWAVLNLQACIKIQYNFGQ
jgi:hypothetical protein